MQSKTKPPPRPSQTEAPGPLEAETLLSARLVCPPSGQLQFAGGDYGHP